MNLFIKESAVYDLPSDIANDPDGPRRWVMCECGNARCGDWCEDSGDLEIKKVRFFKVNGVQVCESCLKEMLIDIGRALE